MFTPNWLREEVTKAVRRANANGEGSPVDTAMQAAYMGEKGSPAAVAGTEGGLTNMSRLPRESEGRRGG